MDRTVSGHLEPMATETGVVWAPDRTRWGHSLKCRWDVSCSLSRCYLGTVSRCKLGLWFSLEETSLASYLTDDKCSRDDCRSDAPAPISSVREQARTWSSRTFFNGSCSLPGDLWGNYCLH